MIIYQTKFTDEAIEVLGIDNPDVCYEDVIRLVAETFDLLGDAAPNAKISAKTFPVGHDALSVNAVVPHAGHTDYHLDRRVACDKISNAMMSSELTVTRFYVDDEDIGVEIKSLELIER